MRIRLTSLMLVALWSGCCVYGQDIIAAAGAGETAKVTQLLEANPTAADVRDSFSKRTPLHFATEKGHLDTAEILLKKGADINAQDYMGMTSLHWAVDRQQREVVEFLLSHKADVNTTNYVGDTPLHSTVWNRKTDLAELLIAHGAKLETKNNNGGTVLQTAAANGRIDLVELLLAKGAELNGFSMLASAAFHGRLDLVERLAKGAKTNELSGALQGAVGGGQIQVAEFLLAHGTDANIEDEQGTRPLHLAAKQCRADMIEVLLASGADINPKDKDGQTPLDRFAQSWCYDQERIVKLFRVRGGKASVWGATGLGLDEDVAELLKANRQIVASRDRGGSTLLHLAAGRGHTSVVRLLLDNGADPNATDSAGGKPLHAAATGGYPEVVELLLDHKADINATNEDGRTPLHYAALSAGITDNGRFVDSFWRKLTPEAEQTRRLAVIKLLLASHADVNPKDRRSKGPPYLGRGGRTPLHYAASYRRKEFAELLLAAGADVNAQDDAGMTPLHVVLSEWPMFVDFANTPEGRKASDEWYKSNHDQIKAFVKVLLAYKANVNIRGGNENKTPVQLANGDIQEMLLAAGR